MSEETCNIRTGVDLAFKLVVMNERLPVTTIARILDFRTEYTKKLLGVLERKKMLKMKYKIFGETEVMSIKGHKEEAVNGMRKIKVFDWVIDCPKDNKYVMFRASCQNCSHFKDVEGQMLNKSGCFEFRPDGVVCGWNEKPDAM
jgi:hypothetical protein